MTPQAKQLIELVIGANRLVHDSSKCGLSPLSAMQLRTVLFVKHTTHAATMKDLAKHFGITAPTATAMINHLEKEQLIKRLPDKNDRRITLIHITAKGEKRAAQALEKIKQKLDQMLSNLNHRERDQLVKLVKKLFTAPNEFPS